MVAGTELEYVAKAENGWTAVVVNGQVGWVSGQYSRIRQYYGALLSGRAVFSFSPFFVQNGFHFSKGSEGLNVSQIGGNVMTDKEKNPAGALRQKGVSYSAIIVMYQNQV